MRPRLLTLAALAVATCSSSADADHSPRHGLHAQQTTSPPTSSRPFFLIADLDANSKDANATKLSFVSYLQHGTLDIWTSAGGVKYGVRWGEKEKATSSINDAGRGFELSELAWYQQKLLTLDDRTGIVFELTGFEDSAPLKAIPEDIIMEGNGLSGKGQKHEWATVKDNELYLGSNGIVITDADGKADHAREWVAVLSVNNCVRHVNWTTNYQRVRDALGVKDPGYVSHEAIEWSGIHKKWFLLPRLVIHEAFNKTSNAFHGASTLIIASEDFEQIEVVEIGEENDAPERGFSSFKFVKDTNDSILVAVKSVELNNTQDAFLTVVDIHGNVLMDDIEVSGKSKFEGLAFASA